VLVPLAIFLVACAGGAFAAARWLPPLAADRVGRLALVAVCVLLGVALALVALNVYETVRTLDRFSAAFGGTTKADILAAGLVNLVTNGGPLLGLAAAVYLLAPSDEGASGSG
jgi:hypothetical protein